MRSVVFCALLILNGLAVCFSAHATVRSITTTIVGFSTVAPNAFGVGAETTLFKISTLPTSTGCSGGNNGWFAFSPTTITDAQTRKNFVANLLTAKSSSASVVLVFDDAGTTCDAFGYPVPLELIMQ